MTCNGGTVVLISTSFVVYFNVCVGGGDIVAVWRSNCYYSISRSSSVLSAESSPPRRKREGHSRNMTSVSPQTDFCLGERETENEMVLALAGESRLLTLVPVMCQSALRVVDCQGQKWRHSWTVLGE